MTTPAFSNARPRLSIDGQERDDLQQALHAMVVNHPLNGAAHAELVLSNWGMTEGGTPDFLFEDVTLGKAIEIGMTDDGGTQAIFRGEVTAVEERFGNGAPSLVLLLQDELHRLARRRGSRSFEDQSLDDVVRSLASGAGLSADVAVSSATATWHQVNESDLAFLFRLLGRFDVALRLDGGQLRARPEVPDPSPLALDTQDSVLGLRLLADLNQQPRSVRVHGYNGDSGEAVDHTAERIAPAPPGRTAAATLAALGWEGEELVPQPFARSGAESEACATAHFRRQAKRFISGALVCQGEPSLRSGREVELSGVSRRLRGKYQIVHCAHRFDNTGGFETHLRLNRPDWSPDA